MNYLRDLTWKNTLGRGGETPRRKQSRSTESTKQIYIAQAKVPSAACGSDAARRWQPCLPLILLLSIMLTPIVALSEGPAFDLAGPKVDVHVQREGKTLPIAEVPNLLPGDRLWIHPDLPETQSTHYILIVTFLRGATNPPPPDWYKRVETWTKPVREEGVFVVVPAEAQQALIFLAPETIGDFTTLRKAVHDRPGAFVRAAQDLQQASWDRLRLDAYLAEVKTASAGDPKELKEKTALAARSLGIRVDQQCFDKPTEQQAPCLVQHTDGLVLDDSNAQSMVTQMANNGAGDMMNQLSYAPLAGAGAFSPYVGAVVDLARILSSVHTAKYQYIPALALPQEGQKDTLNLRLNVPPSFRDPKSVIVVALPPIGPSHLPKLRAPDVAENVTENYCATKPGLALIAEGTPLAFATPIAHDLILHVDTKATAAAVNNTQEHAELPPPTGAPTTVPETKMPKPAAPESPAQAESPAAAKVAAGSGIDIPLKPDPIQGGFVLTSPLPLIPEPEVVGELRGQWGFDSFSGPKFHLRSPHPGGWTVQADDSNALITGREDMLHIQGASTLCVSEVQAKIPEDKKRTSEVKLTWKSPKPDLLEVAVPLKEAAPGTVTVQIHQYGMAQPEDLPLKAYAEAAALDHITLSAGDRVATLKGKRLDEVESADLAGISFAPSALNRVQNFDQLELAATGITTTLQPGDDYSAKVTLRDGRTLHVPATVTAARPRIELISKGIQHDEANPDANSTQTSVVRLGTAASVADNTNAANSGSPSNPNDLPLQRRLVFFLRSRFPDAFPRSEKVEIASVDGSFSTTLSLSDGLMLEDTHTAVAVIDPLARFGASAFGPIQLRAVTSDGITGDWVPLGTLVRLPGLKDLRCPRSQTRPCQLTGNNLFLITSIASNPEMNNATDVPPEFTGNALTVPNIAHAASAGNLGTLYVRLRDDPATVQPFSMPVTSQGGNQSSPGPEPAASPTTGSVTVPASNPAGSVTTSAAKSDPAATSEQPDTTPHR